MDSATARHRLALGEAAISASAGHWKRRADYVNGDQDLPFAPEGVNTEYKALQRQAIANWLKIAMTAPVQRLRAEGFRTGRDKAADERAWNEVWQANQFDAKQRLIYANMMVHDLGIGSAWPNLENRRSPIMRVESGKRVHLELDPQDPTRVLWAYKTFTIKHRTATTLWVPSPAAIVSSEKVGIVYDGTTFHRFKQVNGSGQWLAELDDANPLGEVPFVPYSLNADEDGERHPSIEPLMPQQDALNTIRFNTLLGMQFSAFRQRVFVGYDPIMRDAQGNVIWRKNPDGTPMLDDKGQPMPSMTSPGRIGVDRALVFPGEKTQVFDMPESNMKNYVEVISEFLSQFFATAQIPPQYLLSRMANLSGDALTGAESTLQALITDLQTAAGESHEQLMRLANKARGEDEADVASEVVWADAEPRSFAQIVDGIGKLITSGFPRAAAWEMLPGATRQKVEQWTKDAEAQELARAQAEAARRADPIGAALLGTAGLDIGGPGSPGSPSGSGGTGVDGDTGA